eukprot:1160724-Pelagomonas_calceolata.AAC.9
MNNRTKGSGYLFLWRLEQHLCGDRHFAREPSDVTRGHGYAQASGDIPDDGWGELRNAGSQTLVPLRPARLFPD